MTGAVRMAEGAQRSFAEKPRNETFAGFGPISARNRFGGGGGPWLPGGVRGVWAATGEFLYQKEAGGRV